METKNLLKPNDFPVLDFNKCPACGSGKRVAGEVIADQIKKGRMPVTANAYLFTYQSIIAIGNKWISAPVVVSFYDVCWDCGTVYCIHVDVGTAIQGSKTLPPTGQQFSKS